MSEHGNHRAVYKKTICEGAETLPLAVLETVVEDFQKYVLACKPSGQKLFQQALERFLEKVAMSFSALKTSARPSGSIPTTYGSACSSGRKPSYRAPLSSTLRPDFRRRHTLKGDFSRSCWRPGTVFVLGSLTLTRSGKSGDFLTLTLLGTALANICCSRRREQHSGRLKR
jgi:hypothetical protein